MNALKLFGVLILVTATSVAQKIAPVAGQKAISPDLFGLFFEDINYSADGGLYAELIQNRSFEYSPTDRSDWHPFTSWQYVTPGYSYGALTVESSSPIHPNNPHYAVLTAEHIGEAGVGIKNTGFDGIVVDTGETYNLSLFAKQISANPVNITVSLQTPKGIVIAEEKISVSSGAWKKYSATLKSSVMTDSASLVIIATTRGKIALDVISLFPAKTFNNRTNGLRADMAQAIADIKPKFIRFPGGCLVHGDGLGNMYRWQNTIGPIEQRLEQKNIWGYHQTLGLGYFEYFQFCEDIGAKPLPVLPAAVSCQNSGGTWRIGGTGQQALPMDEMPAYIDEVLDLIEWANGPATSEWGAKRVAAGHPASFHLQYIGIGNEDKITPEFEVRFKMISDAVRAKYPEIKVIGTAGPFPDGEDFTKGWEHARNLSIPIVDEHYYKNPEWMRANLKRYDNYPRKPKVYLGEYASWGNKLANAISEAAYMTALERNGDVVVMASYAPLFAKKDHTQWKTDLIFFDNRRIILTPNYYVQKLFSANSGDQYIDRVVSMKTDSMLSASCVRDSKTGDVIVKLVNTGKQVKTVKIDLSRFGNLALNAELTVLAGNGDEENTFAIPTTILPKVLPFLTERKFEYHVPAMSLSVIRIKKI